MPVTHLINVDLRPGVQSIQVQYKYQTAETWTNYSEGQRIPGGVDVKFTVTTYSGFTLTEWSAYYSDEYGDTVSIPLTGIQGESAWTFTLPSADVYIRCEAESLPSPSTITIPPYGSTGLVAAFANVKDLFTALLQMFPTLAPASNIDWYEMLRTNDPSGNFVTDTNGSKALAFYPSVYYPDGVLTSITIQINVYTTQPPIGLNINSSSGIYWNTAGYDVYRVQYNFITETSSYTFNHNTSSRVQFLFGYYDQDHNYPPNCNLIGQNFLLEAPAPGPDYGSIRYIMSPENSGEVDASAPSEFEEGTTEFTFKWRIKTGYEFKRLTPFAVGEGSLEDDVVYSLEYDGDTRTYTFTISSIPDWAIGVRVLIETIMTGDPSSPIGDNSSDGPIGGNGTFDDSSDEVPLPAIPEGVSAPDTGFVTLFRPTISQIMDLSNYMWSNMSEFIENLQKIFTNPMDYVISLASFPVTPNVGPDRKIYVGNFLTNIQMPPILKQFYEFNCGIINVNEYFGSFLDYAPNTRARIMLPFIGDADLSVNEIMGKTLHLWYRIDLLSGACVAVLTIDNSVYYQWTGNCSIQIPVTASDFSRLYAGIARVGITAAAVAAGGAYLGGLASAASGWNATNAGWHSVGGDFGQGYTPPPNFGVPALPPSYGQLSTDLSTDKGPQLNMGDYVSYTPPIQIPSKKSRAVAAAAGGSFIGHNIMNAIPRVQHAGGMSGNIGIMGNRTPFIVLEYPNVSMPENYKHVFGYPSNMYKVLGSLAGYTKCKQVLFESTKATDDEYEMVIEALKGGVYL